MSFAKVCIVGRKEKVPQSGDNGTFFHHVDKLESFRLSESDFEAFCGVLSGNRHNVYSLRQR